MKKCLACGAERELNDGNNPDACPECGRVYAKVEAIIRARREAQARGEEPPKKTRPRPAKPAVEQAETRESSSRSQPPPPSSPGGFIVEDDELTATEKVKKRWSELGETKRTLVCIFVAFIVGFFAGREHLKHQIAEGFREVAENIGDIFTGSVDTPRSENKIPLKEKVKKALRKEPVTATMTKKGFFNGEYGQDAVTFDIRFENKTDRDIRGFNGVVVVADILDNVIMRLNVKITDPISAKSAMIWSGSMDYNQFLDRHQALKNADFEDIVTKFETTKVLFQDGEVLEFD